MRTHMLIVAVLISLGSLGSHAEAQTLVRDDARSDRITAPTDRAVDFPAQVLASLIARMEADGTFANRLLEGGSHNLNIRHDANVKPEDAVYRAHPRTVDVWVVKKGSGTLVTGGEYVDGKHVGGVERVIGEGDIIFIPAGVLHGLKEAVSITFMNIRYDTPQ